MMTPTTAPQSSSDGSDSSGSAALDGIAIIGMAVRFPGAPTVEEFWRNLRGGVESVTFFTDEELRAAGVSAETLAHPRYVKANAVLRGADEFDAAFFGMTPREAEAMDPQHRVFLEVAWEAMERAGYDSARVSGRVGVFAGAGLSTYLLKNLAPNPALVESAGELALLLGNNKDFVPTRVSYKLNLRGPSVCVTTACSTSLVATHLACQSLLDFHSDVALAGGVSVQVPQGQGYFHAEGGIGSPDGHCRAFDAEARGTVSGNGAGVVVLKRLADAIADGDTIHAVIRGSAVNNDGADKIGFTAPSVNGQSAVITEAQAVAGVTPAEISYVEAHGTGTELGDPIEVAALAQAFGPGKPGTCALGSVKTNFGHLDEAAGIAGLVKTVLALEHRELPPSLNFSAPNPKIDFARTPFFVNAALRPWESHAGIPRRAGVSSFGIGGTNAHVVLEEAPTRGTSGPSRPTQLLLISARTESALATATGNLGAALAGKSATEIADAAYTLAVGRRAFAHRRIVVGAAADIASSGAAMVSDAAKFTSLAGRVPDRAPGVVFLFSGQGAQYPGMIAELYATESVVRTEVDRCAELLRSHLGFDLREVLDPKASDAANRLKRTAVAQPALFVADYALAKLWLSWGVSPLALLGHSLGEYVAACLAGVFTLEDALALVAARGALMDALPTGAMLAVALSEKEARLVAERHALALAAVNAPEACVLSGTIDGIEKAMADLATRNVVTKRLDTSHAFHSAMMEPVLAAFTAKVRAARPRAPKIPIVSNLTGRWLTDAEATNPDYWARHLRQTVRFADGVALLETEGPRVFLEVGPGRALASMVRRTLASSSKSVVLTSTRHADETKADTRHVLETAGRLWTAGVELDWTAFYADQRRHRVVLPSYPFERQRYWIEAPQMKAAEVKAAAKHVDISEWFYAPVWRKAGGLSSRSAGREKHILVFVDSVGIGEQLVSALRADGANVSTVRAGESFAATAANAYVINPRNAADYHALLQAQAVAPQQIIHAWSLSVAEDVQTSDLGYHSLVHLAQALGGSAVETDVCVVSNGVWSVSGKEALHPSKALLAGPVRLMPLEYRHLKARHMDVELSAGEPLPPGLLEEVTASNGARFVALRDGVRWIQAVEPRSLPTAEPVATRIRDGGVYLITGGLGSMGLAFARELARLARVKLVLIGRSAPNDAQRKAVAAVEALGSEVLVVTADVADRTQMSAAIGQVRARFGGLNGVIHTAGVLGQGLIHDATTERAAATFAAKVTGTRLLAELTTADKLDFIVLCSSLAAYAPVAGQVEYCAANAFLDAFAVEHARRTGTRTISIGWGVWQELGMIEQANLPAAMKQAVRDEIAREGWDEVGVDALRRILAHASSPHVLVSPQPLRLPRTPNSPWFSGRVEEAKRVSYVGRFSSRTHWLVNEHRIDGVAILPGTGYLELVRAAFADESGASALELSEVYFLSPLVFDGDEEKEVRVILRGDAFHIASRVDGDRWLEHVRGEVKTLTASTASSVAAAVPTGFTPRMIPADANHFGPRWHNLESIAFGENDGVAELALDAMFADDLAHCGLHPALLDMATGFITIQHALPGSLPFSYRRLTVHRPLPREFRSHVRIVARTATTLDLDATLLDRAGNVLVEISGYRLKCTPVAAAGMEPDNARLMIGAQGVLESLVFAPALRQPPTTGEVEIQVEAAGLNFIEVLYALGLLPAAPNLEASFGLECAGRIARVGAGVTTFKVGDAVIAYAPGSFGLYLTTPALAVAPRPPGLSAVEAATFPAAFATAYYALVTQGRLARGERVLIHAAAGGVGQAAVQIAQRIGAEIFATAGSPDKRDFLRSLGVKHVMDSRSLAFADEVIATTEGRGVNVVLNSLGGEFLAKSIGVLAPYGRFLELGKRDLFKGASLDLKPFTKILSFLVIDVSPEMPGFAALWAEVAAQLRSGEYRPLPHRTFPLTEARAAFEFMARAKHIGKIVLTVDDAPAVLAASRATRRLPKGVTLAAMLGEPESAGTTHAAPASAVAAPPGHARPELATTYQAPADDVEKAIAAVWQELLGVARVGVNDDFFELRGDSLLAAQVMARLHSALQVKLPLSALFDRPTIAGLAELVRTARGVARQLQAAPVASAADEQEEGEI